jgi:long-chain acyl-CoA synthetase
MDKIWLKSYPAGVPATINPAAYASLPDLFDETCTLYADKKAFLSFGVNMTFTALAQEVEACACAFQQGLGLKKGDRIGIMLPNLLQYPIVLWGALKAGLIVVNINPQYTARELLIQLKNSGCVALVVLDLFYNKVQEIRSETQLKHVIVTTVGDYLGSKGFFMNAGMKLSGRTPWFICKREGVHALKPLIQSYKGKSRTVLNLASSDIAFLQYTGGTTGVPKGAILTHENMIANILQAEAWFSRSVVLGQEILITALPLYHIFALMANALLFFKMGALNVLITQPKDLKHFISVLKTVKFTAFTGVNTLFNALSSHPEIETVDFSSLKLSFGGGMAVQRSVARQWQRVTGVCLLQAYGLTEASPAVCINPVSALDFTESVGLPIPSTEVKICDNDGNTVDLGEPGELWVRGPQVMQGYWQNAIETEAVLTKEGWLKTGDMASLDHRGFVKILDRKKELILISGFNVYPAEVEMVIAMHPAIKEVGVSATLNEAGEEVVTAYIVKKGETLTEKEVVAHCRKFLTSYKVPKKIVFRSSLPKSPVGKILKRALSEVAEAGA